MNETILLILQSIYLLIPAYLANMTPPVLKKLKILEFFNKPIDHGTKFFDNRPLFGKNKTFRGFIFGTLVGALGGLIQLYLFRFEFFKTISLPGIDYTNYLTVLVLGGLLGFGALAGDLIESFFKRRLNIQSGDKFVPWDQIDLVIGAYLLILPVAYYYLSWQLFAFSIIFSFFLTVAVNHISFYTGIRKEKW